MNHKLTHTICLLLSVSVAVTQIGAPVHAWQNTSESSLRVTVETEAENQLSDLLGVIDEYQSTLRYSESQFEYWDKQLAGNPYKILTFVSSQTSLIPYRGSLKGSRGVLMDRRGNSLDRSVLFAELLRRGKLPVQLCNTTLSDEQAKILVGQTRRFNSKRLLARQDMESKKRKSHFKKTAKHAKFALADDTVSTKLHRERLDGAVTRSVFQAGSLSKLVKADLTTKIAADQQAIESLRDHWWVRFRDGDEWIELDPTGLAEDLKLKATKTIAIDSKKIADQSIPKLLQHRIEIRVVIEQWSENKYKNHVALRHEIVPSQTMDQPIVLYHAPRKWPLGAAMPTVSDPFGSLNEQLAKQTEWVPILAIGQNPIMQKAFDHRGYILAEAKPSPFGQLGEGLTRPSQPAGILVGEWIEYEIRVPGQKPRVEKREVFRLADADHRNNKKAPQWSDTKTTKRALSLTDSIEMYPQVCNLDPAYVERVFLDSMLANRQSFLSLAPAKKRSVSELRKSLKSFAPMPSMALALAAVRSEQLNVIPEVFLSSPNLITFHQKIKTADNKKLKTCLGMDIVFNQVDVVPGTRLPQKSRVQVGVMDTNLEALMLRPCSKIENTAELYAASEKQKIGWTVIKTSGQLDAQKIPAEIKSRMADTLGSDYAIIIPKKAIEFDDKPTYGWWRINLKTGETLGIGQLGWGQAMTERTALMTNVSKRGEGLIEYVIVLSTIMICGIVSAIRSLPSWVAPAESVRRTTNRYRICVSLPDH